MSDSWARDVSSHNLIAQMQSSRAPLPKLSKDFSLCGRILSVLLRWSVKSIVVTRKYHALLFPSKIPWILFASSAADNAKRNESRQPCLEVAFQMVCNRPRSSFCNMSFGCMQQTTNKSFGTVMLATAIFIFSPIVNYYSAVNVLVSVPLCGIYWVLHFRL